MRAVLALLLSAAGAPLAAQDASPYVPPSHWSMPFVEHLIGRGRIADPSPMTRPLRADALVRALDAVDSATVTRAEWQTVQRIRRGLSRKERGPSARLDLHAGVAASTHARRASLRALGTGHGNVSGGAALTLFFGPVVAVTHPYFDTRLKWDPDYRGKKDRVVAGRNAEAYLAAQWRYGEVFFGSLDRNWGSPSLEGLLVSPSPYSYDHLGLAVGTPAGALRLEGLLTQLDDLTDTSGAVNHRYFVAHRLMIRPPGRTMISLWEGTLLAGPDRQLEPWFANIFTLGLLAQYDQGSQPNNLLGIDVVTGVRRVTLFGSVMIDDLQVDDESAGDQEPASYGMTLGARAALGPAAWTAYYTRVSNLAYRTGNVAETVMRRGIGLARIRSDYDQLTLRATLLPAPGALLSPEITLLRQGEGDFRQPYPPATAFDSTPAFLQGVVERTVRLAVGYQLSAGSWTLGGDGGVHLIANERNVSGVDRTKWVGTVNVTYRYRKESLVP
jgi:hypothetical protein